MKKRIISLTLIVSLVISGLVFVPNNTKADEVPDYTKKAQAMDLEKLPGVYEVTASVGDKIEDGKTIGIPSICKQNLATKPTTEEPAIVQGAAMNYETKTGPTSFEPIPGKELVAPYSYFRWGIIKEERKDADGNITVHEKLSGFDGSYYIVRVDVSEIIEGATDDQFLHVRQESNKAMMVAVGMENSTFADGLGNKTGSYSLANNAAALKDTTGEHKDKPYFDVIILSSNKLAAGADAGKPDAPSADIKLSFYVDDTEDYDPETKWDPASQEVGLAEKCLKKFYRDENAATGTNASSYTVKGSDLEIDVVVDEKEDTTDETPFHYWSLTKAMDYQKYDSHIIKLICEVPVLEGLHVQSTGENKRSIIFDVNSFDIQIANSTEQGTAGLTISNNAELRLMDSTSTAGAELAIGDNATMVIQKGGVMVVDESCTAEVEYDAATTPAGETPPAEMMEGEITVEDGGKIINHGVINIEGTESKPLDPNAPEDQTVTTDMKPADMFINYGGVFDNYGAISLKGRLYVMGTLNNYGRYNDTIDKGDPDKGMTSYHKGILVYWKDVVTKEGVKPGLLDVGIDKEGTIEKRAVINNYGDIVLAPGVFNVYGTFNNAKGANLYLCDMDEAVIPIVPSQEDPLTIEKRVKLNPPKQSVFNASKGTVNDNGTIEEATVEIIHNGVLGKLTPKVQPIPNAVPVIKVPGKAKIKKVYKKKKSSKKVKVKLKKVKGAKGYQVVVSKKKKGKALVKKYTKKLKVTLKSKKLKKKKKLYVRARAYTLDGNLKVFGAWSKAKKVRIKK